MQLVSAAAAPVAKVALFCVVGAWAANRGVLTPEGRRVLSSLSLNILTPCLLFSKLAVGVGLGEVAQMWVLSANMLVSHGVGLLLGLLAVRLAQVPYRLRNQVVLSCGVGNVGNLPFVMLASLAADPALPFSAVMGPEMATAMAMRYVALSNLSAALIQFPLTYIFLQKRQVELTSPSASPTKSASSTPTTSPSPPLPTNTPGLSSSGDSGGGILTSTATEDSPQGSGPVAAAPGATSISAAATCRTANPTPANSCAVAAASATATPAAGGWQSLVAGVFTPPTLSSVAAVAVASVGWLRDALFGTGGSLRLLGEVVDALGAACIPLLLLVLGANLSRGPGVAAGRLPAGGVVAAVATRLLLLPAVCGAALLIAWRGGMLPGIDPLAMLVMLVMHATPTAVLVHSMATIFGNAEDEMRKSCRRGLVSVEENAT
ncbi:hypothetical protein VOLCADRAFT_98930 [Volvox carteri f. nagariensis]|uniref:Auxin efflux carrier n=1 Tax=Volvox carteri f. nagariensis TaxID=3068 RepID=D8UGM7_VOLCA|nr:uncharacterized protein VOLCADRAFT_98930 [Volvox carteri f. nagariensis]EFJ41127.1 hypothetical protein VOLCADRAFT_98930 [Volvox carteri f. nagariensis]|eukprot:XP_002957799.1 hypothetical protein VOLCADRAFT_98930 [Volvox carteri f. nagariensis]